MPNPKAALADVEGRVRFAIEINVTAADLSAWAPEQLRQFFAGLAEVVQAQSIGRAVKQEVTRVEVEHRRIATELDRLAQDYEQLEARAIKDGVGP